MGLVLSGGGGSSPGGISSEVQAALDAKADVVEGKVPSAQLPAVATGQTITVEDEAAMLALTTAQVQPGDVAIRQDESGRRWVLADPDPSVLANWIQLEVPDAVSSVNGQAGTVVLDASDVGAAADDDARLSDARTPTAHTHDDRYYTETEMDALLAARGGVELAYAGKTDAQATVTRAGSDLAADVSGLSITFTATARPVVIQAGGPFLQHSASGGGVRATINDGSSDVARVQQYCGTSGTASESAPWFVQKRYAAGVLTAGQSYTFKVRLWSLFVNGTATLDAGSGDREAWLQAVER